MPSADSLLDVVRSAYARIGEVEGVARRHPDDRMVRASLESLKAHAVKLEEQWIEECRIRHIEVCRYRLIAQLAHAERSCSWYRGMLVCSTPRPEWREHRDWRPVPLHEERREEHRRDLDPPMKWLRARLAEASTYGGLAGLCMIVGIYTFTFWSHWRLMIYAAGVLFIVQAIKAERGGK